MNPQVANEPGPGPARDAMRVEFYQKLVERLRRDNRRLREMLAMREDARLSVIRRRVWDLHRADPGPVLTAITITCMIAGIAAWVVCRP